MIEDSTELLTPTPGPTRLIPRRRPDGRELLDVARRHHLTVLGAARSLVDLAAGPSPRRRSPEAARFEEWEQLVNQLPPRRHAQAS